MGKWASHHNSCGKIIFTDSSSNIFLTLFHSTPPHASTILGPIIPKDFNKICLIGIQKWEINSTLAHNWLLDFLFPSKLFTKIASIITWFSPRIIPHIFTFLLSKFRALSMEWFMCCGLKEKYAPSRSFWMEELVWEGVLVCHYT